MDPNPLERLSEASGQGFPHLIAARQRTSQKFAECQAKMAAMKVDPDVAIVLMGSWGRDELTTGSDDDYMVLVNGPWRPDHEVNPSIEHVANVLEVKPGREGMFGEVVFCDHLEKRIGLQDDDNNNLSRRMLLLLESKPLAGEKVFRDAWQKLLHGYLADSHKSNSPPRLLLNDTVRYWRTICVDFAGKQRKRRGEGWGIRNAKLRTSRKMLFAGGLLPVLECGLVVRERMETFLDAKFQMPPTDRVAESFLLAGAADAGGRALGAYDEFIGLLDTTAFRDALEGLTRKDAKRSQEFERIARLGSELERGLLALLFETGTLPRLVREYAIF